MRKYKVNIGGSVVVFPLLLSLCLLLISCSPATKIENRFTYVRVIGVKPVNEGYWIFFSNRSGIYKSFQIEKPDSILAGKIVKIPKVYRVNKGF